MMQVRNVSNSIKVMSLIATVFVVYRHSFTDNAFFENSNLIDLYNRAIFRFVASVTEIAVPYFFMVSGYFFLKKDYYDWHEYIVMLRKKIRTLFVPFVIWNLVGLWVVLLLKPLEFPHGIGNAFLCLFKSDYYGPLWYVRDLMILMLSVPLYQFIFLPKFRVLLIVILPILLYSWYPVDTYFLSSEGVLFFILGGIIGLYANSWNINLNNQCFSLIFAIWIILCMCFSLWSYPWLHKLNTICGVFSVWWLINIVSMRFYTYALSYSSYSFFIYVTHFYLLKSIKVVLGDVFYGNNMMACLTFLLLPLFVVTILLCIGRLFKKFLPNVYKLSMGGR